MDPREREAKRIKLQERKALLDRAYERVVGNHLEKMSKKKVITGTYDGASSNLNERISSVFSSMFWNIVCLCILCCSSSFVKYYLLVSIFIYACRLWIN